MILHVIDSDSNVNLKCENMLFYHDKSQIHHLVCDVSRNS